MTTRPPVLDIRNLNVEFATANGPVYALQDVSFSVAPGKIVGIVGESGSGKSTVVWSICRLLAANGAITSGELLFNGQNILDFNQSQLEDFRGEQVSIVFQDPMTSQSPVLTYGQQMSDIQYRRKLKSGEKTKRAIAALSRVGIADPDERIRAYPHQFSGGMRQRAGIAMAMMMDPALLVADEATTALDVTMEAQIIHLIRELKQDINGSVIAVSHNLGLIAELCDEVIVMYAGRVIEQGSAYEIFTNAKHPYTQSLLECDPARVMKRTRRLPTIAGDVPELTTRQSGCGFAPRCQQRIEGCDTRIPIRSNVGNDHTVNCHRYDGTMGDAIPTQTSVLPAKRPSGDSVAATSVNDTVDRPALLTVNNLRVKYQTGNGLLFTFLNSRPTHVEAVRNASLSIRRGETVGLVGESGSGKTSLGRGVLRLLKNSEGSIVFDGQEIGDLSEAKTKHLRRDMAMMFQDPVGSLSPRKTVRALLAEPFQINKVSGQDIEERVNSLLDLVGLPREFANRHPHELSGGQARRVGVARALALNPKLIIADEPTAGLDVSVQGEILNLMSRLQQEHGLSYLIISHNLPVVRHVCDRVAIMYLGNIVEQGDCDQIFDAPSHPYTRALIESVPQPDPNARRTIVSIEGEIPSLTNRPAGCEFHPRCAHRKDRCRNEVPETRILNDSRLVRCHFPLKKTQSR